ncbi:MAG: hypothetical protein NZ700_14310 [Gemmataceae bacterium]|nr:hypothetical protein [Gemmataceae bacterium]MDW8264325.1 hypothetical protein [Gemmataceae bacterium]
MTGTAIGGAIFGLNYAQPQPIEPIASSVTEPVASTVKEPSKKPDKKPAEQALTIFPRRLLVVSVNNYLYANPVQYGFRIGEVDRTTLSLVARLASWLHIDRSQWILVSDSAPPGQSRPTIRPVIEHAIRSFLQTSRSQDRVILMFIGHAVVIGGTPYLVPMEGELDRQETLIPLAWVYEQLAECKARQKVLWLDVCRFDPSQGMERPGSGPMSAELDAALQHPPEGIQVVTHCVKDQFSYELTTRGNIGGVVLNQVMSLREQANDKPTDPLPLEQLVQVLGSLAEKEVQLYLKREQTMRLTGTEAPSASAFDPLQPPPPPLVPPEVPVPEGGLANLEDVRQLLDQIDLPPLRPSFDQGGTLRAEAMPPLSRRVLAAYATEADTPLRRATQAAIEVLRRRSAAFPDTFAVPVGEENRFKQMIADIQKDRMKGPAVAQLELEEALQALEEAGKQRDREPHKRTQANYDYVLGRLKARIAFVYEHNYMLGSLRKGLPPRDPLIHTGWRLAAQERMQSGVEARKLVREAHEVFTRLAKEHPGTPWEVLGKRERLTALGLYWEPISVVEERKP